ncbi:MAG: glycine cleavage T C-terminal barrel domain-containing protein [Alphaproteobacteria bacterium]
MPLKTRSVPINLRQSGDSDAKILIYTHLRKSPYWHLSEKEGCWCYATYNHMYHPRAYIPLSKGGLLKEYEYLTKHVTMWNVAVERQIQIKGPDALKLANMLVTRDLDKCLPVNQARYVILCDENGGIINDPVMLRVGKNEIWLSLSDTDVALWAKGVNCKLGYDVTIQEIDVCPVQIQGPKSKALMQSLFGDRVLKVKYYGLWSTKLKGMDVIISRTGWSAEVGYEIYLKRATRDAEKLWNTIKKAGKKFNLKVIAPSHIRRLEAAILSCNQDMDIENNPFEVGLDRQVDFSKKDFIGKAALKKIKKQGVKQKLVGLAIGGKPLTWYNTDFYIVKDKNGKTDVGYVTSAFYSPKLETNIALAWLPNSHNKLGTALKVALPNERHPVNAVVVETPFVDPKKKIPAA